MGKKLVIKGADFSENAVEQDYAWQTILSGTVEQDVAGTSKLLEIIPNLPIGTNTRLTLSVTGSGNVASGGREPNNTAHDAYWLGTTTSESGVVSTEKVLTFDLAMLEIWIQTQGTSVTYLLEAFM